MSITNSIQIMLLYLLFKCNIYFNKQNIKYRFSTILNYTVWENRSHKILDEWFFE